MQQKCQWCQGIKNFLRTRLKFLSKIFSKFIRGYAFSQVAEHRVSWKPSFQRKYCNIYHWCCFGFTITIEWYSQIGLDIMYIVGGGCFVYTVSKQQIFLKLCVCKNINRRYTNRALQHLHTNINAIHVLPQIRLLKHAAKNSIRLRKNGGRYTQQARTQYFG